MKKVIIALFVCVIAIVPLAASDPDVSLMGGLGGSVGSTGNSVPESGSLNEFGINIASIFQEASFPEKLVVVMHSAPRFQTRILISISQ